MRTTSTGSSRTRKIVIAGGLGLVAVLAVLLAQRFNAEPEVALEWSPVERGDLVETVSATGALEALQTVNVGTQVSGTVARVYVDFNSRVKQGDLL
ncbi:MAG TPA: biotin/lipoyl-binding protein, partial [Steroidobacteraceae bacterium]|nr:biotin/lipoyl-binding protein [Steroidobacteraceae bacterium]